MNDLERLERRIQELTPEQLAEFREWFAEFDARAWDKQIAADAGAGKLDGLVSEALAEHEAGETNEL